MIVNKGQLADILDVSTETLSQWQKQGLPILEGGKGRQGNKYDTGAVLRWHRERELTGKAPTDIDSQRLRKVALEADNLSIELERKRGELIPVDQIEDAWSQVIARFRAKLLAIPSRLANQILAADSPTEAEALLRAGIHEALIELSDTSGASDDDSESVPAAASAA